MDKFTDIQGKTSFGWWVTDKRTQAESQEWDDDQDRFCFYQNMFCQNMSSVLIGGIFINC